MDRIERSKRGFEAELIRPLGMAMFGYIDAWARTGGSIPMMDRITHYQVMARVLERHYARVMLAFQGRELDPDPSLQDAAVTPFMAQQYHARAHRQAQFIVAGIDRDLAAEMAKQEDKSETKDDKKPFSVSVSVRFKEAARRAWEKSKGRMKAMANMETETVAEETTYEWVHQHEANARVYKIWNNPMDGKERPWHHEAHNTYQDGIPVNEAFTVGGEKLRFPGDPKLGASLKNLINCRCWLTYRAVKPDGSFIDLPLVGPKLPATRPFRPGDKPGDPTPIRPTSLVTLNGRTRSRVILGDGRTVAVLEQTTPSTIVVRVNRREVARAVISGSAATQITIAPGYEAQGIDRLIRDSVRHSAARKR